MKKLNLPLITFLLNGYKVVKITLSKKEVTLIKDFYNPYKIWEIIYYKNGRHYHFTQNMSKHKERQPINFILSIFDSFPYYRIIRKTVLNH